MTRAARFVARLVAVGHHRERTVRLALLIAVCVVLNADVARGLEPRAFLLDSAIWPTTEIPVCYENPGGASVHVRTITRRAVEDTWERASAVRFVGWEACENDSRGIRIWWDDFTISRVEALGSAIDGVQRGMVLEPRWTECGIWADHCLAAVVVHEFGHALGFAHEQNRADTPANCLDAPQGGDGTVVVGPWDPFSVMNYCNETWINGGELSALDKQAVAKYYGPPVPVCADGVDNDGNGSADFPDDPGCESATDDSELATPEAPPMLVAGKKLKISERAGFQKVQFSAVDPAIRLPGKELLSDPVRHGATLILSNPGTGDIGRIALVSRGWRETRKGLEFRDPLCRGKVQRGSVKIRCKRLFPALRLDEAFQGEVDVRLQFGEREALCTSFGGKIVKDQGAAAHKKGRGSFAAKKAPAPDRCDDWPAGR